MNAQHETTARTNWEPEMSTTNEVRTMTRITTVGRTRQLGSRVIAGLLVTVVLVAIATFTLSARHPRAAAAPHTTFVPAAGFWNYPAQHTVAAPHTTFVPPAGFWNYPAQHTGAVPHTTSSAVSH